MSHDDVTTFLGLLALAITMVALILQVVFGEVTVRRLRKNPETRDRLGIEFVSGMDIVGVAQTLSLPKWITFRPGRRTLGLMPDAELLYAYTTKGDRFLARLFYWMLIAAGILIFIWVMVVA